MKVHTVNKSIADELTQFMQEREISATRINSRHHFLLRMAKSGNLLEKAKFKSLSVIEGYAMLLDDIDAYLEINSDSAMALNARKCLLKSRFLFLEGDAARELSYRTNNTAYLDVYYADLAKELSTLKEDEPLVLLGGPFDHAIVHLFKKMQKVQFRLKTYNGGPGIDRHIRRGHHHYQTEILQHLAEDCLTSDVMRDLFSHKLTKVLKKKEKERDRQLEVIYDTLHMLKKSTGIISALPDDPDCQHKVQPDKTCLRTSFLYWLKEDGLKGEYHKFKVAFGQKAMQAMSDPKLLEIGKKQLTKWQNKAGK
jgi:hypothetical protein